MKEELAIKYIPQRIKEKGFSKHRMIFQDLNLNPGQQIKLAAFNEIWLLLEADEGISITSEFGRYNIQDNHLSENIHEHGNEILITNTANQDRKVTFIQTILLD